MNLKAALISRNFGDSPEKALRRWIDKVEVQDIQGLKEKHRAKLVKALEEVSFVTIDDVSNVWCFSTQIGRNIALLNFVLTGEIHE